MRSVYYLYEHFEAGDSVQQKTECMKLCALLVVYLYVLFVAESNLSGHAECLQSHQ